MQAWEQRHCFAGQPSVNELVVISVTLLIPLWSRQAPSKLSC